MLKDEDVFALLTPAPQVEIEYRIYYNDAGDITHCSMIEHADGNYIVVDKNTYDNYFQYHIVNGKLKKIESDARYSVKLRKSTKGYPVVAGHASLILEPGETYENIEYYERTDN